MGDENTTGVEIDTTDDAATTGSVLTDAGGADDTGTTDTNSDVAAAAASDDTGTTDASGADDAGTEGDGTPLDAYADFVMPEGVTLDEAVLAEANPIFKELGLNQEQAQKLVDIYAKQVQAGSQKQADDFGQLMNDWRDQSKNDSEFGGDKFEENVKIAQAAISKYGTPELKQLFEDHGVGNHPEVVRFMVRVGRTLKEDVPGTTGDSTSAAQDRVSLLYPNDS
jgi:hypothetical protein